MNLTSAMPDLRRTQTAIAALAGYSALFPIPSSPTEARHLERRRICIVALGWIFGVAEKAAASTLRPVDAGKSGEPIVTGKCRMSRRDPANVREYLREVFAHPEQRINRSTLYENKTWIRKFQRA